MTRVMRWAGEALDPAAAAFDSLPCTTPGEDLRLCEEAPLAQESLDGTLPLQLGGSGRLVFIEHDSDTAVPGSADLILVTKDPTVPGGLLVSLR